MKTKIITLTLLIFCLTASAKDYLQVGDKLTDITLTTIDGDTIPIESLQGKVVYVSFFATWCSPCMKEMKHVNDELLPSIKSENFYYIALGRGHTTEQLKAFKAKKGFDFNIGCDTDRSLFSIFSEKGIPLNIVLNKDGEIIFKKTGYSEKSFKDLKKTIKKDIRK